MANPDLTPGALAKPLRGAHTLERRHCLECGKPCVSKYSRKYCSRACGSAPSARSANERREKETEQKRCAKCGVVKPSRDFYRRRDRNRLMGKCISCYQAVALNHVRTCSEAKLPKRGVERTIGVSEMRRA